MQCNQPLFCTGFQNAQFSPYHTQPYYPDIIGEGDLLWYTLPDGSVQCYFVPINRREVWMPHFNSSYYMSSNIPSAKEAWFVRSILNSYPATGLDQPSNNYRDAFLKNTVNPPSYSFIQKFHNDGWTSTTDLNYFFPSLRYDWTKGCAAIQVEIPNAEKSIYHYGTICNRPCYCKHNIETAHVESDCARSDCPETPMCIDEVKSKHSCCDNSRKKEKNRSKNKKHTCLCPRVHTADKGVTTYADRAISCSDMRVYNQTGNHKSLQRTDVEAEIWYPRRRKCNKNTARCSSNAAASDSACSSDIEQLVNP